MFNIIRTNSDNVDFINLVKKLDADLAARDGSDHSFYAQYNKIDKIKNAVVLYVDEQPVACGAFKEYEPGKVEIKRMYVEPVHRGKGLAYQVLQELEKWAHELGYTESILETGKRQPEAISLYQKAGYSITPNYGQYEKVENSVCMKKTLG